MRRYAVYLFDLDGTLFRGKEPIPGAPETVKQLRSEGAQVRFLTNNSSKSPEYIAFKLLSVGISADPAEVVTSAQAAARLCADKGIRRAFVVGEVGVEEALAQRGIDQAEEGAEAVVAGICRGLTYAWLERAQQILLRGLPLIASNRDATYPLEQGRLVPGAGATIAALESCGQTKAIVAGKPETIMVDLALEGLSVAMRDVVLVGDRVDTDVACAQNAGIDGVLVLTGVTEAAPHGTLAIQSVAELA